MFPALLITFRETLEAVIVISIVLTFLTQTNRYFFKKYLWRGVTIASFVPGILWVRRVTDSVLLKPVQ